MQDVATKFYGFSVQESGIYDRHNFTHEAANALDGNGVYVYVERSGDSITIRQDFTGCYGLYVYRRGGRFVISNSFLRLMEYMSRRERLTLNRDYANHYLIMLLSSMAYSETFINEIELLPRDVIVRIDIPSAEFSTHRINYGENTVRLNSAEGVKILDDWFAKWTDILRNIYDKTGTLEADLSGGLDSRMSFTLLMNAGIDLRKVFVNSSTGKGYTLEEDYRVASMIAERFGFTLNNKDNQKGGELYCTAEDSVNILSYFMMFAHRQTQDTSTIYERKHYRVKGFWGESVRKRWYFSDDKYLQFIQENINGARILSKKSGKEFAQSTEKIFTHMFDEISRRKNTTINDDLVPDVYRATWGRSHFGNISTVQFARNIYALSPLADTGISRLKLDDEKCPDKNLLMAVIFTRYCPDILTIRFTKNETISPATLDFARKINAEYPRPEFHAGSREFSAAPDDPEASAFLAVNNPPLDDDFTFRHFRKVFDSVQVRKLFAMFFDEEIYIRANEYIGTAVYHPLSKCLPVIYTAEAVKNIIISEGTQERSITDDFREFAESDFVSESDRKLDALMHRKTLYRKAATLPFRALRKIYRIIRGK